MPDTPPPHSQAEQIPIPEDLRKQLADFQQALWRIKITEAALAGIFGLIFSFLLVFLLERFFPISAFSRLLILLAGTSITAVFAPFWIRRWVYGHRREEQLARLISKKFPKLGDRLLGIVELQNQSEDRKALSPELREAAMAHVAAQAAKRDITEALPSSRHKKLTLGVALALTAVILGFIIAPKAGANALKRWLMPLSDTAHYTFTQFETSQIPDPLVVPLGEAFTLTAPLKSSSDDRPETARARYNQQDWIQAHLGKDHQYRFDFAGQETQGSITLEAGDTSLTLSVHPHLRPEIDHFQALITLPDYLQLPPRKVDTRTGVLNSLEGSQVTLSGSFTREIAEASARFRAEAREQTGTSPAEPAIQTTTPQQLRQAEASLAAKSSELEKAVDIPAPHPLQLSISGNRISTEPITLGSFHAQIPFTWTDVLGLQGADSFKVRIESSKDLPPTAYIQGSERNIVILPEETLELDITSEDDFGLKEIGIAWKGELTQATSENPAHGSLIIQTGSPSSTRLSDKVLFSPQTYGITPQKIQLMAYTMDYKPDRAITYSEPINIYILTREEHAQTLKNRFDRIISELEDSARKELHNLDLNERLDKTQSAQELQNEKNQQTLAASQEEEAKNAEKLKKIAQKMEELFKDAARNGEIDIQTMKDMADAMTNMKELAETDLPQIEQKLAETQDQKSTPEKTESDLKEAIQKQKEALKKMQETIEKTNQASENFEASTFANRLKKASTDEGHISTALQSALKGETENAVLPILGAATDSDDIDPVHARLLKELSKKQHHTTIDVRWIQEDLERFHARTQKPIHKEIHQAMSQSLIDEHLERLRKMIAENRTFSSARLSQQWANTLKKWAEKLQGSTNQNNQGGGGGGGGAASENQDFEFMLKVMRMVQAEQDIRARTRSLEQMLRSLKLTRP